MPVTASAGTEGWHDQSSPVHLLGAVWWQEVEAHGDAVLHDGAGAGVQLWCLFDGKGDAQSRVQGDGTRGDSCRHMQKGCNHRGGCAHARSRRWLPVRHKKTATSAAGKILLKLNAAARGFASQHNTTQHTHPHTTIRLHTCDSRLVTQQVCLPLCEQELNHCAQVVHQVYVIAPPGHVLVVGVGRVCVIV